MKRKRGFDPQVPDEDIVNVLSKLDIFDESNKLKTKKYDVWKIALNHSLLKGKIYIDNLYRRVSSNRNKILDRLKKNFDIFDDTNPSDSSSENNSEIEIEHDCSDYCEDRNPHNSDEITFNISLTDAEWVSIKPTDRMWGKKMFLHLQEDWVDIMNKKIIQIYFNDIIRISCQLEILSKITTRKKRLFIR